MSSSDFAEETLTNRRTLPCDIDKNQRRLNEKLAITSITRNVDRITQGSARNNSPLHEWCAMPLEAVSTGKNKSMEPFKQESSNFRLYECVEEIVKIQKKHDAILVIAPTGVGKTVLAPYVAERLAMASGSRALRKSLLVGPSAEHCGNTARIFYKLFASSGIDLTAFRNLYEEETSRRKHREGYRGTRNDYEFVISTYNSVIQVLPESKLNLLILDEIHDPNDNVQVALAMALKMLQGESFSDENVEDKQLNKLMLMTATLDQSEIKKYKKYFESRSLSFAYLDYSNTLNRTNSLTLSCLNGSPQPVMFESTHLSKRISIELEKIGETMRPLKVKYMPDDLPDELSDLKGIERRVKMALVCAMGVARENLQDRLYRQERGGNFDMQSIIVILPGLEQVDKIYSSLRKGNDIEFNGQPGFYVVRLTSLVKDDESFTSECLRRGNWEPKGNLARIVLTTNLVAAGLTIPNVACVIDSGLQKILCEYTKDGLRSLETMWIDELMMTQRAGRTGRTNDGEYCLPYSVERVDEIVKSNHGKLLLNRNFDERHLLYKFRYGLEFLHEPPQKLIAELQKSMEIRGVYSPGTGIPDDVKLMDNLFRDLPPEYARIIIQGIRLGIAAHAVLLVADLKCRYKFCHIGTVERGKGNGPSPSKSAIYLYSETMSSKSGSNLPESYDGVGDSIVLADLLASFYSMSPTFKHSSALDNIGITYNNFWSGDGSPSSSSDLYKRFVKDEGRDDLYRNVSQIVTKLLAAGLLSRTDGKHPLLNPNVNRHIVSRENFCLNQDGRALISALLTMQSSRVGKLKNGKGMDQRGVYEIYREKQEGKPIEMLFPDARCTQPQGMESNGITWGRFFTSFKKKGKYTGLIDPISLKNVNNFININGDSRILPASGSCTHSLNASTRKNGIKIKTDKTTCTDAKNVRSTLKKALKELTYTTDQSFVADLEKLIISVWREGEKTENDWDESGHSNKWWSRRNVAGHGTVGRRGGYGGFGRAKSPSCSTARTSQDEQYGSEENWTRYRGAPTDEMYSLGTESSFHDGDC